MTPAVHHKQLNAQYNQENESHSSSIRQAKNKLVDGDAP